MSFGKINIDPADVQFSKFIRMRDGRCVRCGTPGTGPDGIHGLQNSHYFSRGRETTRYDVENCDALCAGCHQFWESSDREAYTEFKKKHLGENGYKILRMRSYQTGKKDRKMALIISKALLADLIKKRV